ncbi:MAG: hypothetical protein ACKVH8_06425 [Pirellulales bacterium]
MAFGHTDDVPNAFDLEASPTPESSTVLHDFRTLSFDPLNILKPIRL